MKSIFNRIRLLAAAGLFLVATTGCDTLPKCGPQPATKGKGPPDPNLPSYHVLNVNADGFLLDLRPRHNSKPIKAPEQVQEYLNETILAHFRQSGKQKLLLFVHGGLNPQKLGMQHFWDDYDHIMTAGDYYPVFVVWPSGLSSTYLEHLLWVRQGIKAETSGAKAFSLVTVPFVLLSDFGRALTRLPMVVANNTKSDLGTVFAVRHVDGGAAVHQYQELIRSNYLVAIGDDYSRSSDLTGRAVTYWSTLPVKYFFASLIDGLGKGAWDDMLRRTSEVYPARLNEQLLIHLQSDLAKQSRLEQRPVEGEPPTGGQRHLSKRQEKKEKRYYAAGVPAFIRSLQQMQKAQPDLEITLVGHSMGTIILNRVVRDADLNFANIIYLGAACSIEDFQNCVLSYMQEHRATQFYNLSLHPVAEAGEWYPTDLPPRGSLLIWVDNFLSNPVTEQARTLGAWENLFRSAATGEPIIRGFYDESKAEKLKERLHFEAMSVGLGDRDQIRPLKYQWNARPIPLSKDQRCDNPLSHGEFSEIPYWNPDLWWRPYGETPRSK